MEKFLDLKDGVTGLLVSLCLIGSLQLIVKMGEFLWKLKEKKDSASESAIEELTKVVRESTLATQALDTKIQTLEHTLSELPKLKLDMKRFFIAVKTVAGEQWPEIRREMMEEEKTL